MVQIKSPQKFWGRRWNFIFSEEEVNVCSFEGKRTYFTNWAKWLLGRFGWPSAPVSAILLASLVRMLQKLVAGEIHLNKILIRESPIFLSRRPQSQN